MIGLRNIFLRVQIKGIELLSSLHIRRHYHNQGSICFIKRGPNGISQRYFSTFIIQENIPYQVLKQHPLYQPLIYMEESSPVIEHEGLKRFVELANSNPDAPASDPKYEDQVSQLLQSLKQLTDTELIQVLSHWRKFPKPSSSKVEPHKSFWMAIDLECINRAIGRKNWRIPTNFILADLWNSLGLAQLSNFHWQFVKQLLRKMDRLSREQMIRFCFCFTKVQNVPESINLYDFEYNIPRIMKAAEPPLDSNEVALISLALFKTKSPVHSKELMKSIMEVVIRESDTISSTSLSAITKTLKLGSHRGIEKEIKEYMDFLADTLKRHNTNVCAQLANLGTRGRIRSDKLLNAIVQRAEGNLEHFFLKDLEFLVAALSLFNVDCPSLYEESVATLRKLYTNSETGELNNLKFVGCKYSRSLPNILNCLTWVRVYPEDLISLMFSKEFLETFFGNRMYHYTREMLHLDQNVLAGFEDYKGDLLTDKSRGYLLKKNMEWIEPQEKLCVKPYQFMCRNVYQGVLEILGHPDLLYLSNIMPHQRTIELVFCTNDQNELVKVPEEFKNKEPYLPKTLQDITESSIGSQIQFHAVLISYWDNLVYNTDELLGNIRMLKCQMEKLGYKTYTVNHWTWKNLKSKEEQIIYLKNTLGFDVSLRIHVAEDSQSKAESQSQ